MSSAEAPAALPLHVEDLGTELVARARARRRIAGRSEIVALCVGVAFLAAATCAAILLPALRPFSAITAIVAVAAYAIVSRLEFEVGNGFAYPAQLVLVPMLFALPPRDVPLLVAAGFLIGQAPSLARGRTPANHVPIILANASHSLGPAVVLSLAGARSPHWADGAIYAGALAAQFSADSVPSAIWSRLGWDVPLLQHAKAMRVPVLVDTALAPIGLAIVISTHASPWGILVGIPLVALLQVFARERRVRLDHALQLSTAYRGTAMLLGDVIEADDEYTGAHSRDVVELVVAVAERLGLGPVERQRAEFAALLHDVGKVKIPPEIINKPGPLDEVERTLMNTHTIVGQTMLEQVGGLLGDVGDVVRSCHERWDGGGYPDGLAGEAIPFEARIVCACDAWSAMTTDRSYRAALPVELALAELRACAGTQFDPRVVDALVAVLEL